MTKYPVQVSFDRYSGRDPRKLKRAQNFNRIAALVRDYINSEIEKWPEDTYGTFFGHQVATTIREDNNLVHLVIAGIDGGSNGVTVWKGDYERAMGLKHHVAR